MAGTLCMTQKSLTPRLTQPMIRYKRGEPFTPVSWEEAISYTAKRLSEIKEKYGNESIMVTGSSVDQVTK